MTTSSAKSSEAPSSLLPNLSLLEWLVFAVLAALIAAANIYTTLLIGWGDTGSIVAVLASVAVLGGIARRKATIYQLNLGQTMVSAGGGVGFAVACYAALHIVDPEWGPDPFALTVLFASAGLLGTLVGSLVRKQMVQYFFPSGTACAVIQRAVGAERAEGEGNRPVRLLTLWSLVAGVLTFPTKVSFAKAGELKHALLQTFEVQTGWSRLGSIPIGVDPLYYGIGLVVGPRVGLGMILGALLPGLLLVPMVTEANAAGGAWGSPGEWVKWTAIAVLTAPTFATIVFAYRYRREVAVPAGFTPGATAYARPAGQGTLHNALLVVGLAAAAWSGSEVFDLPWYASVATMAMAIPLSVVNGRVCGDTDINPVRLVAIVLLSAFFWLVAKDAVVLLGMAVLGATIASVAVDMMQDLRTGHLLDQNPHHQTAVQFAGVVMGAIASVPVLHLLVERLGVGDGGQLAAPGAKVWAEMARAMAGGIDFTGPLIWGMVVVSVVGSVYAFLTVHPSTARFMPSLFGLGIGLLVGLEGSLAIFLGGLLKQIVTALYGRGSQGEARREAEQRAGDDTMVAGASVFAAGAVLSILLVVLDLIFEQAGVRPWFLAGGH